MKIFGQIFGGFYAIFGFVVSLMDFADWANIIKVFPQVPETGELAYAHIFVFLIGVFFAIVGSYIFVKSR